MSRAVEWTDPAFSSLKRLDRKAQQHIADVVNRFASTGHGDVRKLQGYENQYRLRVGRIWRVLFSYQPTTGAVQILRVLPRGSAYR